MQYTEHDKLTDNKVFIAMCNLAAQLSMNSYAAENAVCGHIKAGEPIPFDKYIDDLGFRSIAQYIDINQLDGPVIQNGYIKDLSFDAICFEFYSEQIDFMFFDAPKFDYEIENDNESDSDIFHYKHGLYEYLKNLYSLFREIVTIGTSQELFKTIQNIFDKSSRKINKAKLSKFIVDIKVKHLRRDSCVDRYFKDLPIVSPFIRHLLKKNNGRSMLANNDTGSIDYKLALFSCFDFKNIHNAKLFEIKMLEWKLLNR